MVLTLEQDRSVPFADTLAAMDALHRAGKFKRLGLSNFAAFEVAEVVMTCVARGWVRPTVYQAVYNCLQRGIEAELLPACRRYGLDVVVYSPIAGGLMALATEAAAAVPAEVPAEGRFSNNFLNGWARERYFRDSTLRAVGELQAAADRAGIGAVEVALRWLAHHSALNLKDGDGVIIGVSKLEHVTSNIDCLEKGPLPAELADAVDRVYATAKPDEAPYWLFDIAYGYDTKAVLFGDGAEVDR